MKRNTLQEIWARNDQYNYNSDAFSFINWKKGKSFMALIFSNPFGQPHCFHPLLSLISPCSPLPVVRTAQAWQGPLLSITCIDVKHMHCQQKKKENKRKGWMCVTEHPPSVPPSRPRGVPRNEPQGVMRPATCRRRGRSFSFRGRKGGSIPLVTILSTLTFLYLSSEAV